MIAGVGIWSGEEFFFYGKRIKKRWKQSIWL